MSTVTVSSAAGLQAALSSAKAGDVIALAAGNYGDVTISKSFSSDVTITSMSESSPAVFRSLTLNSSSHLHLDDLVVNYTPTASTDMWSSAVSFNNSSYITFTHSTVTGGNAVSGVAQSASALDSTGNVIGMPTARGVLIGASNHVTVDDVEVSKFYKGIVLGTSDYVTLTHNDVHDTRTTPITAGGGNHIVVDANDLHDVNPWKFGPTGDHADYLAMWTNAGQTTASTDIQITNNLMEQGKGTAVLGMWLQGGSIGYTDVKISGNAILGGHFEGLSLWDVKSGVVDHNILLQTSGGSSDAPIILVSTGSHNISVHDNQSAGVTDESGASGSQANAISANTVVQMWNPGAAGYYTSALITSTEATYASIVNGATTTTPPVTSNPTGAETLTGTAGGDVLTSTNAPGGTTIYGGAGGDTLTGGSSTSFLRGEDGDDYITARHGFNDINGNAGNDTIFGGDGNDWLVGGRDNDLIYGGGGNQILYGNLGDDILVGGGGSETLRGGQGDDSMSGGAGNDWMSGDLGADTISGGAGADTFHTFAGAGIDRILDFNSAEGDRVMIDPGTSYTLRFDGANMIVDMGGSDQLVLVGVTPTTLGTWLSA